VLPKIRVTRPISSKFDDQSDDADHNGRDHQHGEVDIDAGLGGGDGGVAAEHDELAMREVDHPHHAEHDRQSRADQREKGDHVENFENDNRRVVHSSSPFGGDGQQARRAVGFRF
jgi:hypothetical protein